MVMQVIYSTSSEKLAKAREKLKVEQDFFHASDEYVSEKEKEYESEPRNLKIVGGKWQEENRKNITSLILKEDKSF